MKDEGSGTGAGWVRGGGGAASTAPVLSAGTIEQPARSRRAGWVRGVFVWLLHVAMGLALGAAFVGAAGAVASLTSSGRVALLEVRGVPVVLGGSAAIVGFTFLRTSRRQLARPRPLVVAGLAGGFAAIVAVAVLAGQARPMRGAQGLIDRAVRVYGPSDGAAVRAFRKDVGDLHAEIDHYQNDVLKPAFEARSDANRFRIDASASEETMKGIVDRMRAHAEVANNVLVRESLEALAAIFDDERSGVELITRGVLSGDPALIEQGNTRFKDAETRAGDYASRRVRPVLERAHMDAAGFVAEVESGG